MECPIINPALSLLMKHLIIGLFIGEGMGTRSVSDGAGSDYFCGCFVLFFFINLFIQRLFIIIDQAIKHLLHIHPMFLLS